MSRRKSKRPLDLRYRPVVTVVDVMETGACLRGILRWVDKTRTIKGKVRDYPRDQYVQIAANTGRTISTDCGGVRPQYGQARRGGDGQSDPCGADIAPDFDGVFSHAGGDFSGNGWGEGFYDIDSPSGLFYERPRGPNF